MSTCAAVLSFLWGFAASLSSPHISSDIAIPLLSIMLFFTTRHIFGGIPVLGRISSINLACLAASLWWIASAIYATCLKGLYSDLDHFDAFHIAGSKGFKSLFGDSEVSYWMLDSVWIPLLNLILIFVPLPSIYLSIFINKNTSEDVMFILSIISALPIIGASVWSIRLLGLFGLLLGTHRCNQIGNNLKLSNRVI